MAKSTESSDDLFGTPRKTVFTAPADLAQLPLAARMRPETLEEISGQRHLLSEGKLLWRTIRASRFSSLIFYGPPGTGKTTLAYVISRVTKARFISLNAVLSGAAELREAIQAARQYQRQEGVRPVLFIDEIHRFNRAQQDILMPDLESGVFVLIGATTHNPSFALNGPLLSRATVFELRPLEDAELVALLKRALQDPVRGFGKMQIAADEDALLHIAKSSCGDARRALNALELGVLSTGLDAADVLHLTRAIAEESCQRKVVYHDKDGDYHYDLASAFIKSIRGSDPDAAVYWLAKMIHGGEDPRFILRRLLILASEDIGNADPQALPLAAAALQAFEFVGMPESQIILAQVVTYLACAPKSNASYMAIAKALEDVKTGTVEEVPAHLRDSHYPGAKTMGHGQGYKYSHDYEGAEGRQDYRSGKARYYDPKESGFESEIRRRLAKQSKP